MTIIIIIIIVIVMVVIVGLNVTCMNVSLVLFIV